MSATQFATVLTECIVPRAPRIPTDLALLDSESPMAMTLRHMGGQARVDRAHAHAIRNLIAAALRGE
jgi:hypothetical protein